MAAAITFDRSIGGSIDESINPGSPVRMPVVASTLFAGTSLNNSMDGRRNVLIMAGSRVRA